MNGLHRDIWMKEDEVLCVEIMNSAGLATFCKRVGGDMYMVCIARQQLMNRRDRDVVVHTLYVYRRDLNVGGEDILFRMVSSVRRGSSRALQLFNDPRPLVARVLMGVPVK